MLEVFGDRNVSISREISKIHEEVLRGSAAELAAIKREWKGELVIGIHGTGNIIENTIDSDD